MDDDEIADCCSDEEPTGFPDLKPPCTVDTCGFEWASLADTNGRLGGSPRLRGSQPTKVVGDDCDTCDDAEDCGVLRCFEDADGNQQGIDVDLFGDPITLGGVGECVDENGDSLYENPLRRIRNIDGSCSLGVLPFPVQDIVCNEELGCGGLAGEGEADTVFTGCARQVCTSSQTAAATQ